MTDKVLARQGDEQNNKTPVRQGDEQSHKTPAHQPDEQGHFGIYGGRFVAETLLPPLYELEEAWKNCLLDAQFQAEL